MGMSAKTKRRITHAYCNENLRHAQETHKIFKTIFKGRIKVLVSNRGLCKIIPKVKNV